MAKQTTQTSQRYAIGNNVLYAYTGGTPHRPEQPYLIFIHGVLNDHSVWALQSRYFAHHGWNVLAIDLPGHSKSTGAAPASVEDAASTVETLIAQLPAQNTVSLIGHSFGSLIALEVAARLGHRIGKLALLGTAAPMAVSDVLLDWSLNAPEKALHLVNVFSRHTLAPPPSALGPGTWPYGMGMALGRRVLRSNQQENVFHKGFVACNSYNNGPTSMAAVKAETLILSGTLDQMTPARAARPLVEAAQNAAVALQSQSIHAGHNMMTEAPEATLQVLQSILR
ncbi:alpha/beta hydrolase [Lampropedia puyangensis]|uniref:Alpha/beta hydrolase n=1 Tax=Lampropedia puyangensis TaxID=1330072 RepID=A0A4S8ESW4_9BURK|nr:alpha/beta hydrolase [Lampropedia puyangensis]THT97969.1 alpha/beta hydrolase [Lampropedia puyangensis]